MMENKQQYQGLTSAQVEESRRLHGENVLTPPKKTPLWKQFLEKFDYPDFVGSLAFVNGDCRCALLGT